MLQVVPFFLSVLLLSLPPQSPATATAYDALRAYGLPIGLLPKGIHNFTLDASGRFEAHLDRPCLARFESSVRYNTNVSGSLSYGRISSLSGVSAQDLFLWLPVRSILVEDPRSGVIFFDVGAVRKQFSLSLFETPPDCSPSDDDGDQVPPYSSSSSSSLFDLRFVPDFAPDRRQEMRR